MAVIDFPVPSQVGETFTDPNTNVTYTCVVLGPPAEWTAGGTGGGGDFDTTYLRIDASNDPVTGNLAIGGSTATPAIGLNINGDLFRQLSSTDNKYTLSNLGNLSLGGTVASPNISLTNDGAGYFARDLTVGATLNLGRGSGFTESNCAFGHDALATNSAGTDIVAIGDEALMSSTNASENVAIGSGAMKDATTSGRSIAIGFNALENIVTSDDGDRNHCVGYIAGQALTSGGNNALFGYATMYLATSASQNTMIGGSAGGFITSGNRNTALGYQALYNNDQVTACIQIGCPKTTDAASGNYNPAYSFQTGDANKYSFGNTSATNAYIQVAWTAVSDERDKKIEGPCPHGLDFVKGINPIKFKFRTERGSEETNGGDRYGFRAQEILALEGGTGIIVDDAQGDGSKYYLNDSELIPVLVNAIKELEAKVAALEAA